MFNEFVHPMRTEVVADQQLVRFTCQVCDRCVESGPEGLHIVHRGDTSVRHEGGNLGLSAVIDVEDAPPAWLH